MNVSKSKGGSYLDRPAYWLPILFFISNARTRGGESTLKIELSRMNERTTIV